MKKIIFSLIITLLLASCWTNNLETENISSNENTEIVENLNNNSSSSENIEVSNYIPSESKSLWSTSSIKTSRAS